MVRSMLSRTDLPISFWGYALETTAFLFNRIQSKAVEKTPYELWTGKRLGFSCLKIWGYEAYVKRQASDKLASKSDKCLFMDLEYDLGMLPTLSEPIRSHIRMSYNGMLERLSLAHD